MWRTLACWAWSRATAKRPAMEPARAWRITLGDGHRPAGARSCRPVGAWRCTPAGRHATCAPLAQRRAGKWAAASTPAVRMRGYARGVRTYREADRFQAFQAADVRADTRTLADARRVALTGVAGQLCTRMRMGGGFQSPARVVRGSWRNPKFYAVSRETKFSALHRFAGDECCLPTEAECWTMRHFIGSF